MEAVLRGTGGRLGKIARDSLGWWLGELAALVPRPLRRSVGGRKAAVMIDLSDAHAVIARRRGETADVLLRLDLAETDAEAQRLAVAALSLDDDPDETEIVLRLPAEQALWKTLELPAAAEGELHDILRFELDRQTPYAPEQVYFDHRIRERRPGAGQLRVDLVVVPRERVDAAVARVRRWGLSPTAVDVAAEGVADGLRVNLLPAAGGRRGPGPRLTLNVVLATVAVVLLAAAVAVPLRQHQEAAVALEAEVSRAKVQAAEASRLREEIARLAEESGFLADKRRTAPLVVEILDELTRLLPDDSWLAEVHIKGDEVRILGFSPAASTLIGQIEESSLFRGVRFRSPVTQVRGGEEERFDLSFEVMPRRAG